MNGEVDIGSTMATATPLDPAFGDFGPIDETYLAQLPPDLRAQFEESERRYARGEVQVVPHSEIETIVERQRLEATKVG
jgi:hypothetical protein